MKKLAIALLVAFAVSNVGIKAFAVEDNTLKNKAGITPDSILYTVDKAIDSIKVAFTFNNAKKVEVLIKVAEERLGESEVMAEEEKDELAEKALESYNETMDKAQEKLDEALKDSEDEKDQEKVDKINEVEKTMLERTTKNLEVLKGLQDKVGENAQATIKAVIEMQLTKKTAVATMVEKRHELNDAKQAYNSLKAKLEEAKKAGDAATIAKMEEELKIAQEALTKAEEAYKLAFEAKQEAIKAANDAKKEAKEAVKDKKDKTPDETKPEDKAKVNDNNTKGQEKKDEIKTPANNAGNANNGNDKAKGKK